MASSGLSGFLWRVCPLHSCGPPTSLLSQQHRHFFWRKWKNSSSVVRPTTVRPAYGVPKVTHIPPPKQYQQVPFKRNEAKVNANRLLRLRMHQRYVLLQTFTWSVNQMSHLSHLSFLPSFCLTVAHCETRLCRKQTRARMA